MKTKILCGIAGLALVASASLAAAEEVKLKADLKGASEVPAVTTKGSGKADIVYDTAAKKLSWTVTYADLSGPATAAHFHGPGEPGKIADVAVPIPNQGTSPVKGSATLTDTQAADLLAGKYYVNVHPAANAGGEIRGQVTK